jgi:3D (Asp-Asp-Asp) domain-containing protein
MKLKKTLITISAVAGLLFAGGVTASAAESQSVVDYLYVKGEDYSFAHRSELAAQYGITGYRGTASQNLMLLAKLKGTTTSTPAASAPVAKPATTTATQPSGKTMTMTATAYVADCQGCSGVTYTGVNLKTNPGAKVIAADPSVLPMHTKVFIEGYGTYSVEDTGSAIKGNRIDIFMPNYSDAVAFGMKQVKVTILD